MRTTILCLAILLGAAPAALAQPAPPPDAPPDATDDGGTGYLPGAQFQRRLDGAAGFSCTATNALLTDKCSISCRKGETADCVDADGNGSPSCSCSKG